MATATERTAKLTKQELAQMLADALNLLNDVRACDERNDNTWTQSQEDELNMIVAELDVDARDDFYTNVTLNATHLGMKRK